MLQLQERQKWFYPSRKFAVNDVVLVVDDRVPRSFWPLGRVTSVHKSSKDERVRSVTIKTRTSLYDRPVDKIVLLESVENNLCTCSSSLLSVTFCTC